MSKQGTIKKHKLLIIKAVSIDCVVTKPTRSYLDDWYLMGRDYHTHLVSLLV